MIHLTWVLLSIIVLMGYAKGHSSIIPEAARNTSCFYPEPAKIYSWHIHFIYWNSIDKNMVGALRIRERFMGKFNDTLGSQCTSLFHMDYSCMFKNSDKPVGPFKTAQWAVFVTLDDFSAMIPWIMQNRGKYDVLIHPNTGCGNDDHSDWAFWGGQPQELNMKIFSEGIPWTRMTNVHSLMQMSQTSPLLKTFLKDEYH